MTPTNVAETHLTAMFIAAIMFAMGYGAIRQALNSHESLKEQQTHLLELQNAIRIMEQDFVQAAARPVRQAVGDEPGQPAMTGGVNGAQGTLSSGTSSGAHAPVTQGSPLTQGGSRQPPGESDVRTMARASLRSGPCCNVHIHAVLTTSAPPPRAGSILVASPCSS